MTTSQPGKPRIEVADALRGFAVAAIILLHSIEHFNLYSFPPTDGQPAWLNFTDRAVWDGMFFMFGGKAYAIFALLFGFSFYVMYNNQERRGYDFRGRFCWRLILLFIIGNINAAFFTGEVLVLYSIVGFVLPLVCRLPNKAVLWLAALCMIQPAEIYKLACAMLNPEAPAPVPLDAGLWGITMNAQTTGTFMDMLKVNLWEGQLASLGWAWENARMFQTAALFMIGMIAGRNGWFADTAKNRRIWGWTLACALIAFFPLYGLSNMLPRFIETTSIERPLLLIISSLHKCAFMFVLVTGILFAFYSSWMQRPLRGLMSYGRMSLTNYITQSIIGSFLFYNWGLGLYQYLGITASICVGACILAVQILFCNWWMRHHTHGPIEWVWRKLTWIGKR
jgi:uncharacterized protein